MKVMLRRLAHSRSGDKGNTSNIAVIAYDPALYSLLSDALTAERVKRRFGAAMTGGVTRYAVDRLGVLNFVCEGALGGGVSRNLCLDNYGKTLAAAVLDIEIDVPDHLQPLLR